MGNSSSSQPSVSRFPLGRNCAVGLLLFVENDVVDVQAENQGIEVNPAQNNGVNVVEAPAENQAIDVNLAGNQGVEVVDIPVENQGIEVNPAQNNGVNVVEVPAENQAIDVVDIPVENQGVHIPAENHVVLNGGPPMGNGHLVPNGFIEGALFGNFVNGGLNGFVQGMNGNIGNGGIDFVAENGIIQNGFVQGGALFGGGGGGGGLANGPGAPNPFDEEADLFLGPPNLQYLPPPPWEAIPLNPFLNAEDPNPFLLELQYHPLGAIADPVHEEQQPLGAGAAANPVHDPQEVVVGARAAANQVRDPQEVVVGAGAAANPVRDPYELVIGMVNPCLSRLAGENLKLEVIQIENDGTGYTLSCLEPNCSILKHIYVTKPAHNH